MISLSDELEMRIISVRNSPTLLATRQDSDATSKPLRKFLTRFTLNPHAISYSLGDRFEQVVECVLCMIESFVDDTITGNSTVSILNSEFDLMCASKSAYALTRLGAHNSEKLCTIQPRKIMKGLSKYSKALLSSNSTDLEPSEVSYCCYVFGYVYRFSGIRCEGTLSECCRRMVEGEMYKNMLVEVRQY